MMRRGKCNLKMPTDVRNDCITTYVVLWVFKSDAADQIPKFWRILFSLLISSFDLLCTWNLVILMMSSIPTTKSWSLYLYLNCQNVGNLLGFFFLTFWPQNEDRIEHVVISYCAYLSSKHIGDKCCQFCNNKITFPNFFGHFGR